MNRVKVDPAGFGTIILMGVEPKMKYEDGVLTNQQDTDATGLPIYSLTCAIQPTDGKPEMITVKVAAAQQPAIEPLTKIAFANLTAFAYVARNRAEFSFTAEKVGKARE